MKSHKTIFAQFSGAIRTTIAFSLLIFYTSTVFGGTKVIGLELGTSTLEMATAHLSKFTNVYPAGTNRWTNAPMLRAESKGFDIEGLRTVTLVFDKGNLLAGVIMTIDKFRYDSVVALLSKKYQRSLRQDLSEEGSTIFFNAVNTTIEVNERQVEPYFEVAYMKSELLSEFERRQNIERIERAESEAKKF